MVDEELYTAETYRELTLDKENLFGHAKPFIMPKFDNTDITEDEVLSVLGEFL